MRKVLLLTLLYLTPSTGWAAPPQPSQADAIFRKWNNEPGGAIGVVRDGKLVLAKGYGYADVAHKTPNTPSTNYDLASLSKQFTATAVLLQVQQGRLSLTDRLDKYVQDLPVYATKVTIQHLLQMTSGLPDYDDSAQVQLSDLVETLDAEQPSFRPGHRYEYLNMNYALLTFVVEAVSKQKLGQILESQVFQPLGMHDPQFLSKLEQSIPKRAIGYKMTRKVPKVSRNDVPGVGDGNVFSNVQDLSLWAIDLLKGSRILNANLQKAAWTSGETTRGKKTGYGYGFEIGTHLKQKRVSHTGSWNGTSTYIGLYPSAKVAVIVLSNREEEDVEELGEQLAAVYLKK